MRARVEVSADELRVIPAGLAKLWALRWALTVPLVAIDDVRTYVEDEGTTELNAPRKAGTYRAKGVKAFLVVGKGRPVVVIECPGAKFDRVVFSAEHPETVVRAITRALPSRLP